MPRGVKGSATHGASGYTKGCRCGVCRRGVREYRRKHELTPEQRQARDQERRAWLHTQKLGPCADCGQSFPPVAMDFDHKPGEIKSFQVGDSMSRSKETLLAEIAKCELVCANCHRVRTNERAQWNKRGLGYLHPTKEPF